MAKFEEQEIQQIKQLWKMNRNESPLYVDEVAENGILFIGLNPSTVVPQKRDDNSYPLYDEHGNLYSYFKVLEEISKSVMVDMAFSHLDLLFLMETNQKQIENLYRNSEEGREFILEQVEISKRLIKRANPKIIYVCNAFGSRLLKATFNLKDTDFDEKIGTYIWEGIPVFLSGMISSTRRIDEFSLERLKWHIKRTLKEMPPKS